MLCSLLLHLCLHLRVERTLMEGLRRASAWQLPTRTSMSPSTDDERRRTVHRDWSRLLHLLFDVHVLVLLHIMLTFSA